MKRLLLVSTLVLGLIVVKGQTNVSGGIFSNTTWTKVNSPYIVIDTVVVFPGVTLTIQPGVIVKFNNNIMLEIRQAQLIAVGTATDSITFTANSISPSSGFWRKVHVNGGNLVSQFKYCNFRFAGQGLYASSNYTLSNSDFYYNTYGLYGGSASPIDSCNFRFSGNYGVIGGGTFNYCNISNTQQRGMDGSGLILNNCTLDSNQFGIYALDFSVLNNCYIRYNQTGIGAGGNQGFSTIKNTIVESNSFIGIDIGGENDTIINCQIQYNGTGMKIIGGNQYPNIVTKNIIENNLIGIELWSGFDSIYCNRICNNISYGLKWMGNTNINNVVGNYWCTTDSASTSVLIYDGYDNPAYGLVSFMPIDSLCAPGNPTSVNENTAQLSLSVFPNPTSGMFQITSYELRITSIEIYNVFGEKVYSTAVTPINNERLTINLSSQPSGLYFIRITQDGKTFATEKLVITDH